MRAKLKAVKDQLRQRMHEPVPEQGRWLAAVVRGHMAYYAVPGNARAVAAFRDQVARQWLKTLRRRSQKPGPAGRGCTGSQRDGYRPPEWCIPSPRCASPPHTPGRSPVR